MRRIDNVSIIRALAVALDKIGYTFYENGEFLTDEDYDPNDSYAEWWFNWLQADVIFYTDREKEVARMFLDTPYKWIAKDQDGKVNVYTEKPIKLDGQWVTTGKAGKLDILGEAYKAFPNLKWDDEWPTEIGEIVYGE